MLEGIFAQVESVAASWQLEVKKRRRVTAMDPVADTIEYCASEVRDLVSRLKSDTEQLTPAQYARIHKTTPQTVTGWCRKGKIEATPNGHGWLIPRNAQPPKMASTRGKRKR